MHIAIEGMDAVGKTTAAKLLAKKMDYTFFPKSLHDMIDHSGKYDNFVTLKEYTMGEIKDCDFGVRGEFLYFKLLDKNIVSDRYYVSNYWAHTHGKNLDELKKIIDLLGVPDVTFILYADKDIIYNRMVKRNPNDKDLPKIKFIPKAYEVMKQFVSIIGMKHVFIDTSYLTIDEVVEIMMKIIEDYDNLDRFDYNKYCSKIPNKFKRKIYLDFEIYDNKIVNYFGDSDEVTIPKNVNYISNYAFKNNTNIRIINIPKEVKFIGDWAFDGCYNLEQINVDFENENYSSCEGILFSKDKKDLLQYPAGKKNKEYYLDDNVENIGVRAFVNCYNIKKIILGQKLRNIGFASFFNCKNIESIIFNQKLESIGRYAFINCNKINYIKIEDNKIFDLSNNILYNLKKQTINKFILGNNAKKIKLLDKSKVIEPWAFANTKNIDIIELSNDLVKIGAYAFYESDLKKIIIKNNVEEIGDKAFWKCEKLEEINILKKEPPSIWKNTFLIENSKVKIHIPKGSKAIYQGSIEWKCLFNYIVDDL